MTEPAAPRMDATIRAEWVRRLRSGDYLQGVGALRYAEDVDGGYRYCCLGVLCAVAAEAGVVEYVERLEAYRGVHGDRDAYGGVLPPAVVEWAGLAHLNTGADNPVIDGRDLASHNDGTSTAQLTFARIADLIEEYL